MLVKRHYLYMKRVDEMIRKGVLFFLGLMLIALFVTSCAPTKPKVTEKQAKPKKKVVAPKKKVADYTAKLGQLETLSLAVTISQNDKKVGTWTQKKPNWRYEDPEGKSIIIYNAKENKLYSISPQAKTAVAIPLEQQTQYMAFNPLTITKGFQGFSWGIGAGNRWEASGLGGVKAAAEFNGPRGLMTLLEVTDSKGVTTTWRFEYEKVGAVEDSQFELPPGVTLQTIPQNIPVPTPGKP